MRTKSIKIRPSSVFMKKPEKAARYSDDTTTRGAGVIPDLTVDFVIADIGYQLDLYIDGKCAMIECRDFGGSPSKKKALEGLVREIDKAVTRWRSSL